MLPRWCRIMLVAAAVTLTASLPALAQFIPPSERPGRERERFEQPQGPLAQPGASPIALPGAVAPPGADKITLKLNGVRIVGGTVYSPDELATLYAALAHDGNRFVRAAMEIME